MTTRCFGGVGRRSGRFRSGATERRPRTPGNDQSRREAPRRARLQRPWAGDSDKVRPVVIGAVPVTDDVRRHLFASYQHGDGSTRA